MCLWFWLLLLYLFRSFLCPQSLVKTLKSFPFTAWKSEIFLKIICYFKFKEFIVCGFLLPVICNGWKIVSSSIIWDQRAFWSFPFLWNSSTKNILKTQNYVYQMLWKMFGFLKWCCRIEQVSVFIYLIFRESICPIFQQMNRICKERLFCSLKTICLRNFYIK